MGLPEISVWNIQPVNDALSLPGIQNVQFEGLSAESVNHVTETLPVEHVYERIGRSIGNRWFRIISSDVGEWVRESLGR